MATTRLKAQEPKSGIARHAKVVLFGKPGVGKSYLGASMPKPYYIDSEGGAERAQYQEMMQGAGGAYMGREHGAASFDEVIEQVRALAEERHPYKTLVIDSLSKLWNSEIISEQIRLGDKDAFGASKKLAIRKTRSLLNMIDKLKMNVVLICHEIPEWAQKEGSNQREVIGYIPDAYEKVPYEIDLTLRVMVISKGNRVAQVHKTRILSFPEGDRFNLQVNGTDTAYSEFSKRYGREAIEAPSEPVAFATAEQVSEIVHLVSLLKVDDEEIKKKLAYFNADSWSELTADQADGAINKWLKKKLETPKESAK